MHIRRALISVYDKTGITQFARTLQDAGVTIISTGGTARHLQEAGIEVVEIESITNFPEILDGRVKTLHPRVHAGLLARRNHEDDVATLRKHDIDTIDIVVVNLYPFQQTVARPGVTMEEAMENVDIGGPTMLRAAAKNHAFVVPVVNPASYDKIEQYIKDGVAIPENVRRALAHEAFAHTAAYDAAIAQYVQEQTEDADLYPNVLTLTFEKQRDLRYGENPHQTAALYAEQPIVKPSILGAELLHGKPLSFNNVNDANAAFEIVCEFSEPAAVAVKHTNPCGVGIGESVHVAYERAYNSDPVSIFGGIVALNRTVDEKLAQELHKTFLEVIIAPEFTEGALNVLTQKPSLRLLRTGPYTQRPRMLDFKRVRSGLLVQSEDVLVDTPDTWRVVTEHEPTDEQLSMLWFGWRVVKHVKSNAVLLAKDFQTIGIGAGQMNRILPTRMSIEQAGEKAKGSVLASDAFFPFPDVVEAAAEAGIQAIVQPGGSKRDADSIEAANKAGIAMLFTGNRHFQH